MLYKFIFIPAEEKIPGLDSKYYNEEAKGYLIWDSWVYNKYTSTTTSSKIPHTHSDMLDKLGALLLPVSYVGGESEFKYDDNGNIIGSELCYSDSSKLSQNQIDLIETTLKRK